MGVNTTKAFKAANTKPIAAEVGNPDVFIIADDDMRHFPFTGHQQGYLPFNIMGDSANLAGQIMGYDLVYGNLTAIKILKSPLLAGLKAGRFTIYLIDNSGP